MLRELDALDPWRHYVAGRPDGNDWIGVDQILADPGIVATWIDQLLAGPADGRSDVAGSYLSAGLGGALLGPAAALAIVEGRSWPLAADSIAVRWNIGAWFDGLAVRHPTLLVLPGDAAATHPHAEVVADQLSLYDRLADEAVELLIPLFAQIRSGVSFGTAGMWGGMADGVAHLVVDHAQRTGGDPGTAWTGVEALFDRLPALRASASPPRGNVAGRAPRPRSGRPALTPVPWSGGVTHFVIRGTCCLYHKVSGCDLDPTGEAYCVGCPKRDPDDRRRRWSAGLEERADGASC